MYDYNIYIKEAKRKFIETGEIPKGLKDYVAQSWIRCRALQLEKKQVQGRRVAADKYQEILNNNKDLIEVALPIMENILKSIKDIPTAISLSDSDGIILKVLCHPIYKEELKKNNYYDGFQWDENSVGTNAMSLCMQLGKPVQTVGAEHYCDLHERYTGTGVPIFGNDGKILGCLNSINDMSQYSDYTLGMMVAGVSIIEKQMMLIKRTTYFLSSIESVSEGIILADHTFKINTVNSGACKILGIESNMLIGNDLSKILLNVDINDIKNRIKDKRIVVRVGDREILCIGTINVIKFNLQPVGISLVFKAEKTISKTINKIVGNRAKYNFDDIITDDPEMKRVIAEANRIALLECNVLILGESGTGKELFAQSIHNGSRRANGPFIAINCAALPRDLVESELFGYEEGAFTGARKNGAMGKFELANGGTIFLDEIGEMPIEIQAKLLRVLDSRKITRLGSSREQEINVRIIAATNRDMEKMIEENSFRLDLYYRLNVVSFEIPPLRERKNDIPLLCEKFISSLNSEGVHSITGVSDEYLRLLQKYNWKGNIRELQNVVARSYYICDKEIITEQFLPKKLVGIEAVNELECSEKALKEQEKNLICQVLEKYNGNITKASMELGISKPTIYRKIKNYGIEIKR